MTKHLQNYVITTKLNHLIIAYSREHQKHLCVNVRCCVVLSIKLKALLLSIASQSY